MNEKYIAVVGEPFGIKNGRADVTMIISDRAEYNLPLTVQFQSTTRDFFEEGIGLLIQKYPEWSRQLAQALARLSPPDNSSKV